MTEDTPVRRKGNVYRKVGILIANFFNLADMQNNNPHSTKVKESRMRFNHLDPSVSDCPWA